MMLVPLVVFFRTTIPTRDQLPPPMSLHLLPIAIQEEIIPIQVQRHLTRQHPVVQTAVQRRPILAMGEADLLLTIIHLLLPMEVDIEEEKDKLDNNPFPFIFKRI
jgi:hypothetical protein